MDGIWKLPFKEEIESSLGSEEVCVVGVFGKSVWGHTSKSCVVNKLANTSTFLPHYFSYTLHSDIENETDPKAFLPSIDCYYDREKRIVYLHLTTVLDAATLSAACVQMGEKLTNRFDCHYFWKSQEVETAFALVYLFSVCHVLILVHPVPTFDISYDKLFHHVSNMRIKLLPFIKDVLKECSVGRDWWVNGRPCPPRLLFVIQRCGLGNARAVSEVVMADGVSKKKKPPLKRLQHTLEDQVYKILRNSRVLTNNAVNCLFTVPPNQAFVHIMTDQFEVVKNEEDPVKSMLQLLRNSCETHRNPTTRSRAYRLLTNPPQWTDPREEKNDNPLWTFLCQHTDLVFNKKGFKDSVGRNPLPTHFEIPQFKNWLKVANNLHHLFFQPSEEIDVNDSDAAQESKTKVQEKIGDIRSTFHVQMDPEARFSEARCSKLVSLASAAYQSNLPLHYTSKVHNNQLSQALAKYKLHARGPARDKYELCVQEECEAFWNDGRRLCEVRSLTGRHCIHRFHDLPGEGKPQPDLNPPKMYHSSRSRSIAASSCGRIQGSREDPFTLKEANYDFYKRLDGRAPALSESDVFRFPVYVLEKVEKPSSLISAELHNFVEQLSLASNDVSELAEENNEKENSQSRNQRAEDQESDQNSTQDSDAEVNEDEENKDQNSRGRTTSATYDFSLNSETMPEVQSVDFNEQLLNQPFTDGMVHSGTPEDIYPLFSSWNLVRIGSASSYIPSRGLDMPGFIPGTNHLIPWDIAFQTEDPNITQWPVPGEARKIPIKETKPIQRETSTRAFVGYEYETPRGQRFICSSPDKAVKVSNSGAVKDSIQPLLDMDMPLYTTSPISGRSGKMLMGQLMRIIIVTPAESNVHITIKPQVIPGPHPTPTFHPSQPEMVLRHNSMWVLRFPYVYVSDSGSHQPPKDVIQLSAWRVLKMLSVVVDN